MDKRTIIAVVGNGSLTTSNLLDISTIELQSDALARLLAIIDGISTDTGLSVPMAVLLDSNTQVNQSVPLGSSSEFHHQLGVMAGVIGLGGASLNAANTSYVGSFPEDAVIADTKFWLSSKGSQYLGFYVDIVVRDQHTGILNIEFYDMANPIEGGRSTPYLQKNYAIQPGNVRFLFLMYTGLTNFGGSITPAIADTDFPARVLCELAQTYDQKRMLYVPTVAVVPSIDGDGLKFNEAASSNAVSIAGSSIMSYTITPVPLNLYGLRSVASDIVNALTTVL
jgi:hypothetical protein